MNLQGKTALLPGASRPLGRAIGRCLAKNGVNLILPYYDWPESSEEMIEEFSQKNIDCLSLHVDLRDKNQVEDMILAAEDRFHGLDILVNNIERGGMPIIHGSYNHPHNRDQWQLELDTTLHAKWLLYQNCLPLLRQSGSGCVVNITSIAGITGRSGPASILFSDGYSAANRAVSSLTETWAREAAPTVRVNELMLGLIDHRHGRGTRGWAEMGEKEQQKLIDHTLLNRSGSPEEVAQAALFMIRDSNFMTGSVLRLDGGFCLGGDRVAEMPDGVLEQEGTS
ncbi:MAG: SDR family oxidoreductase [Thermodesulfobacteriota bacterium]